MTAPAAGRPPPCGKPSHRAGGALACPDCLAASVAELLRAGRPGMGRCGWPSCCRGRWTPRAAGFDSGFDAGLDAGWRLGRTAARLARAKRAARSRG
jgi:hypothetical protein